MLLCPFHHQIAIHRWGWTLVVNPDGTTTAWNKDKTRVLHSHGPRPAPGRAPGTPRAVDYTTIRPFRRPLIAVPDDHRARIPGW